MRSRLRRLHAHDRQFTWTARIDRVRTGEGWRRCVRVRVWGAGKNSRALQVDLLSPAPRSAWGDPAATDGAYPEPKHVRAVIDHALGHGWQPDEIGGTFLLTGAGHAEALPLPGFVLTDLLLLAEREGAGG
ncbi:integrase [Plantactinospora sp. WMMB782]|uniref:integrase n=1 Tax=Plantactinospora sp. WMMB782 TaxID=3404121 RepID=UPI003B94A697